MSLGPYTWWNNPFPEDPYYYEPQCERCDDQGCPDCVETYPVELEDIEEIDAQIAASDAAMYVHSSGVDTDENRS